MSQAVKVKGYGRAVFPDHFTKEQMRTALRKRFNNAAESTAGALDAAATVGSAVVAEPVSGLAGIGSSIYNMDASKGADTVKAVQDAMTYQPRTAKGQEYLQNVSDFVEPVANIIGSASQNLGDKAYEATGSPTLAAAAYSAPTAIVEGLGLKGLSIAKAPAGSMNLSTARSGFGAVNDKWSYLTEKSSKMTPEKVIKTDSGEIRFFDASDSDGVFKDAKYYDKNGNVIGELFAGPDYDGKWVGSVEVKPEMRRKGIATELYNQMEAHSGSTMKPATSNSKDAAAFWKSRDSKSLVENQSVDGISENYKKSGVQSSISERANEIVLNKVIVPKEARGSGVGTNFMKDLVRYAKAKGKTLTLTPSSDFGGNKARLVEFYKRFGFVENKGKNKDYEISEAMYLPKDSQ